MPIAPHDVSGQYAAAQALLQRHGLRLTFARIATMALLLQAGRALGVDAIFAGLSGAGHDLSRSSVYRALTEFHKAGLVLQGREDIESGKMVYARAPEMLPALTVRLRCTGCGRVIPVHDKWFAQQLCFHAKQWNYDKKLNDIDIRITCNDCAG